MSSDGIGEIAGSDFVARHALWDDARRQAAVEAVRRAREAKVRTVRVSFADQHGVLRGKTLVVDLLETLLKNGCSITSTLLLKDTAHKTVYPVWQGRDAGNMASMSGAADLLLLPDPSTFRLLPWSEGSAWMLADCYFPDGSPLPVCTRGLCRAALARLERSGYRYLAGLELEFHVFKLTDPRLEPAQCGQPSEPPTVRMLAHGYQYLTESRFDELEPVLEQLRAVLVELDLPVRTMEVEMGPSQCELTFAPVEGLRAADHALLVRSAIKQVSHRSGYHATFMCRPALPNIASSGWHLHQSLIDARTGANAFVSRQPGQPLSECGRQFVAGLLDNAPAACLLSTPTINGYKRYRPYSLAPKHIVWGRDNRGAMIRLVGAPGDPATHIENRIGEPAANPYLYFASQIVCGMDGIERGLTPPAPVDTPYDPTLPTLPANIVDAIAAFKQSALFGRSFGQSFVDYFSTIKEFEVRRYLSEEVTDWEQREYFEIF